MVCRKTSPLTWFISFSRHNVNEYVTLTDVIALVSISLVDKKMASSFNPTTDKPSGTHHSFWTRSVFVSFLIFLKKTSISRNRLLTNSVQLKWLTAYILYIACLHTYLFSFISEWTIHKLRYFLNYLRTPQDSINYSPSFFFSSHEYRNINASMDNRMFISIVPLDL